MERVKGLLEQAKANGRKASARVEELRLAEIEAGLLREELGVVREDCGRLVQLIR